MVYARCCILNDLSRTAHVNIQRYKILKYEHLYFHSSYLIWCVPLCKRATKASKLNPAVCRIQILYRNMRWGSLHTHWLTWCLCSSISSSSSLPLTMSCPLYWAQYLNPFIVALQPCYSYNAFLPFHPVYWLSHAKSLPRNSLLCPHNWVYLCRHSPENLWKFFNIEQYINELTL